MKSHAMYRFVTKVLLVKISDMYDSVLCKIQNFQNLNDIRALGKEMYGEHACVSRPVHDIIYTKKDNLQK